MRIFAFFLTLLLTACASSSNVSPTSAVTSVPAGVVGVSPDAIWQQAQQTLPTFLTALQQPQSGDAFQVQGRFVYNQTNYEGVWLKDPIYDSSRRVFTGTVQAAPQHAIYLSVGERVEVDAGEVVDWAIIRNGILIGGWSLRAYRDSLEPTARAAFDKTLEFRVEP